MPFENAMLITSVNILCRLSTSDMQQKIKELGLLDPLLKYPQEVRYSRLDENT